MHAYTQTIRKTKVKKEVMMELMFSTSFRILLILAIVGLGIAYVLQMTSLSSKGFVITDLHKQVAQLKHENKKLAVTIAEKRSLVYLQQRIASLGMVDVAHVTYLTETGNSVAFKR